MRNQRFKMIDKYEALCLALSIDEEKSEYFGSLADKTDNPRIRNELAFLKNEERNNSDYFARRIEEMENRNEDSGSCDPEGKLRKWVEEEIIEPFQEARETSNISSSLDALRIGAALQKKTIDFYNELMLSEQMESEKEEVARILAGEQDKLKKLNLIMSY